MTSNVRTLALLLAALAAAGCLRPAVGSPAREDPVVGQLVWPQPPDPPRVRFVGAYERARDMGIRRSFWGRIGDLITGRREARLVRPTGVAARGSVIYVADPGAQALWVLDAADDRWRAIRVAGEHALVSPVAVAVAADGRVYLVDSYLARVLIFDARGLLTGSIASPQIRRPTGVAYDDENDRLYVADSVAHRIWIFARSGAPIGAIGERGTGPGQFNFPTHLALDRSGTLFVTDALNFRVQMFDASGTFVGQFGRHGDSSGDFASPKGIAVDSDGHVYVAETLFDAVQIFDQRGRYLLSFGARGIAAGQFWLPGGLFIDERNHIYVADAYNRRIQVFHYLAGGGDA